MRIQEMIAIHGFAISLIFILTCNNASGQRLANVNTVYKWNKVEFMWPNTTMKNEYIRSGKYIVNNNIIAGLKVFKNNVYVTVPRWRSGVPSTLNMVTKGQGGSSVLQPFPNWKMQEVGNCNSLQYVQSMEIDPNTGMMWIIDVGRVDILGKPKNLCPAKLVIYDLNADKVDLMYTFPDNIVSRSSNFMNDIVLDYVNGEARFAYITDTQGAKLHVYDYKNNISYSFQHSSMQAEQDNSTISIGSDVLPSPTPIDGIAMSPDFQFLYYCPLGGYSLYRVPTMVLREKGDFNAALEKVGTKISQTDGMVFGQKYLYYGAMSMNGVYKWDRSKGLMTTANQQKLVSDNNMQWCDTFSIDDNGDLWFVSNTLQQFFLGTMNFNSTRNYINIWKVSTNDHSYLWTASQRTKTSTENNTATKSSCISYLSFLLTSVVVSLSRIY